MINTHSAMRSLGREKKKREKKHKFDKIYDV